MNKVLNWVFGSFFRTLGRVLVYILIGYCLSFLISDVKLPKLTDLLFTNVNALEGLTSSGESIANSTKIGSRYVGSNYYYEFSSGTYDQSALDLDFGIEYNGDLNGTGTTDVKFYVDYCVNGSIPDFVIYSTYLNNVEYSYSLNKSIYLSNGEWSKAQCYRSFITLNLNYTSGCSVQGTNCLTTFTDNNNTFALLGNYGYNVLLRYTDLVYLNSSDYSSLLNQARIENANNTIIEQNNAINNSINNSSTNIINNQNSNTQAQIDNQNANTDKEIESQKVCEYIDKNKIVMQGYLNATGKVRESEIWGITDFIKVNETTKIKVLTDFTVATGAYIVFYDINKNAIDSKVNSDLIVNQYVNIPSNTNYVRFSIDSSRNKPTFEICKNGNQAIGDSLNDMNSSINDSDSSGATSDASSFFSNFTTDTHGLTGIITAPLNAINSLTNQSCSPLVLPLPFVEQDLTLPCMRVIYDEYFGSFMTLYDVITLGIVSYWVMVRIFGLVKDFKNPEHDEIEVVDL